MLSNVCIVRGLHLKFDCLRLLSFHIIDNCKLNEAWSLVLTKQLDRSIDVVIWALGDGKLDSQWLITDTIAVAFFFGRTVDRVEDKLERCD